MNISNRWLPSYTFPLAVFVAGISLLAGCVPMDQVQRPSLREVRLGNVRGQVTADTRLLPGEISGEVTEIDRGRREIIVRTDEGRREVLPFDFERTQVLYHGYEYRIENIESGDRIAYQSPRRGSYVDTIRIQEPVQARSGSTIARPLPPRPRTDIVEGTVERINPNLGVFEIRPSTSERTVTVSVPYNARTTDIDSFRTLRRGDTVRVEGEFVNPDNLQLLAFLPVDRR